MAPNLAQIRADVAYLKTAADEQPLILANSSAPPNGPLYDPRTAATGNWQYLAPPNPTTRDRLLQFTRMKDLLAF